MLLISAIPLEKSSKNAAVLAAYFLTRLSVVELPLNSSWL